MGHLQDEHKRAHVMGLDWPLADCHHSTPLALAAEAAEAPEMHPGARTWEGSRVSSKCSGDGSCLQRSNTAGVFMCGGRRAGPDPRPLHHAGWSNRGQKLKEESRGLWFRGPASHTGPDAAALKP